MRQGAGKEDALACKRTLGSAFRLAVFFRLTQINAEFLHFAKYADVLLVGKVLHDVFRHYRTNVFYFGKLFQCPVFQFQHMPDFCCDEPRGLFPEVMNAQTVQQSVNGIAFGFFNAFSEVFGRFFAKSVQF